MRKIFHLAGTTGALAGLLLSSTFHAHAIGIRSDGKYSGGFANFYDQANSYANVANIMKFEGGSFSNSCTATLINSRTIVTAAHCLVSDSNPDTNESLQINGKEGFGVSFRPDSSKAGKTQDQGISEFQNNEDESLISGFVVNPNYGKPPQAGGRTSEVYDIAIISLDKPILGIEPTKILTELPKVGEEIFLVGYGTAGAINVDVSGTGSDRELTLTDDKRRVAGNYLEHTGPLTQEIIDNIAKANPQWAEFAKNFKEGVPILAFDADDPANPRDHLSLEAEPNDKVHAEEGGTASGDSGGPMFVVRDGVRYLVGMSNSGGPRTADGYDGSYGNLVFHASIAANMDWLLKNDPLKEVTAKAGKGNWSDLSSWNSVNTINGQQVLRPENTTTTQCNPGEKGECKHSTYFNVTLDQATDLSLDVDTTIDGLTLSNANSVLRLQDNRVLDAKAKTEIRSGRIALGEDSELNSNLDIFSGGTLSGRGEVEGTVRILGAVAPGADTTSPSAILMTGKVSFLDGSRLQVAMDKTGKTDFIGVDGQVDLSGGILEVTPSDDLDDQQHVSEVVKTNSQVIQGMFKSVKSTSAFFAATAAKTNSDQSVEVTVQRDLDGATRQTKEKTVMSLLKKGLGDNDPRMKELFQLIRNTSSENLDKALKTLKGDVYSQNGNAIQGSMNAISNVLGQLRNGTGVSSGTSAHQSQASSFVRSYAKEEEKSEANEALEAFMGEDDDIVVSKGFWSVWGKFLAGVGRYDGQNGAADTTSNTFGFLGGGFYTFADDSVLGAYGGYTETSTSQSGNSVKVAGISVGLNGETSLGDFVLGGHVQYSNQAFDANRSVILGGQTKIANGRYDAHIFSAAAEVSRSVDLFRHFEVIPFAGLEAHHARIDGFTESGASAANLTVNSSQKTSVYSDIGVRFEKTWEQGGFRFTPQLALGWRAELTNPDSTLTANLAGQNLDIKSDGQSRHALTVGLGLSAAMDQGPTFEARYDGRLSSTFQDHQGSLRLTLPFD
jgi:uncharacterized protein with beta-barrel porin domain